MQTTNSNNTVASGLNFSAWDNRYIDREQGLKLALEAKESALKNNHLQDYYLAQLIIAQYLFWKTNEGEQLISANQSLAYFEKENKVLEISKANAVCAGMYDQYGEYEKAMRHAVNAVKASELIEDDSNKGDCYTLLGQIYSRIHDYASAIQTLQKALEIRKKIKENKAVASSLNLIARNYVLSKQYIDAKTYYEESLLLRETIGDTAGIPWTYLGLASLYSEQKEWKQSLDLYTKAELANQHKEKQFDLLCLLGKGKIYLNQANTAESINYLNEALSISKSLKISSLESEAHQLLAEAYESDANLALALEHYKKYNSLKQDILSNEKVNMLKNQQIAFSIEHAENEAEIHRLKHVELKNAFDQIALQHHELEEKSKEIIDSITYAKRIQDAYLPERMLFNTLFENAFLLFKPKDIVSGDFYWYTSLNSDTPSRLLPQLTAQGMVYQVLL
jgi:tetratricopeptide (TPR) repeat protein